ncbi:unnamed protein product [Closterium sp. Yama58-4]|nr:unnamed protein product [Closterium sp. Yama58-4]
MAGGHGNGHGITHGGLTLHPAARWHKVVGTGMCAMMWFWILYRAKEDGPVLLVSLALPNSPLPSYPAFTVHISILSF